MKNIILLILFTSISLRAIAGSSDVKIEMPGAGIKSVRPNGFTYPRIGTYLRDDTGLATIVVIAASTIHRNSENDLAFRKHVYPGPSEAFSNGNLAGRLYKRSRAGQAGKWDGTWLSVTRGSAQLSVLVSFSGPVEKSPEVFRLAQPFLDRLEWDANKLDSEQAFGAKFTIPGMSPVKKTVGTLMYNKTGEADRSYPDMIINAVPGARVINAVELTQFCGDALTRVFSGRKYQGPYQSHENGVRICDGWGPDMRGNQMYVGVASLPSGDVIYALGHVPETMKDLKVTSLREAILNVKLLR